MSNFYRLGLVQQVNDDYTCDVFFEDTDMVCEGMQVMNRGTRNRDHDLPNVDDVVLCLFVPPFMSDGIVLGCVYTEDEELSADDIGTWAKVFPDGSLLTYIDGEITISAKSKVNVTASEVNIKATQINLNGKLMINDEPYKSHKHEAGTYMDGDSKPVTGTSGGLA